MENTNIETAILVFWLIIMVSVSDNESQMAYA